MKQRRSTEPIEGLLRQADLDLGKGMNVPDVCRRLGISQQTYFLGGPGTAARRWSRRDGSGDGEAQRSRPISSRKIFVKAATAMGRSARMPRNRLGTEITHRRAGTGGMT